MWHTLRAAKRKRSCCCMLLMLQLRELLVSISSPQTPRYVQDWTQSPHDRHQKASSLVKTHQNTVRQFCQIWSNMKMRNNPVKYEVLIEGLHAKRVYIEFWPIFIFCRIELILADWLVLTWKASFRNCFGRFALRSPEIMYAETLSFPLETFCSMTNKRNLLLH